jgi:hypothetical protein
LRFVGPNRAWGHRVYTSGMEWVAPPDAPDSQPCAAQCTMYGNRFEPVCAARRIETAAWTEHRADEGPVEPDRDDQHPSGEARHPLRLLRHLCPSIADSRRLSKRSNARSSSAARCSYRADAAGGLARTTSRLPRGSRSRRSRIRCRSRRLTLFLTAAPPTARLTTKPTKGVDSPETPRCTTKVGRPARLPRLTAASNSSPRRMRDCRESTVYAYRPPADFAGGRTIGRGSIRPTASRGPYGGERRGWRDRPGCASAAGSRGSSRGDGCSAGKYACSRVGSRLEGAPRWALIHTWLACQGSGHAK